MSVQTVSTLSETRFRPALLLVDDGPALESCAATLLAHYDVEAVASATRALEQVSHGIPELIVTELDLPDGDGVEICRAAWGSTTRPFILVATKTVERVPAALSAGCDAVLLKPFPPNLLVARLSRLRREAASLRDRARRQCAKGDHLIERSELARGGTNKHWPNTHCPHCGHEGVTSFDNVSYRRMWYACLACQRVWIAARKEDFKNAPERADVA